MHQNTILLAIFCLATAAFTQQAQPTPYDLLRPVFPENFSRPWGQANQFVPDTLDQLFRDSLNIRISPIRVNQAGYRPQDAKLIYFVGNATSFDIVLAGTLEPVSVGIPLQNTSHTTTSALQIRASNNAQLQTGGDTRYTMSGTGPSGTVRRGFLPEGLPQDVRLRIRVGNEYSSTFVISSRTYSMVKDALLKFFGIQRSGNSESWFHPPSHLLDGLPGGWYDCGDHLKEGQTQSYALAILGLMAAIYPNRDTDNYGFNHANTVNTDGIPDMLREARHGAEYILNSYEAAGGNIVNMVTSVGNFGQDHSWWGRPEFQDRVPTGRGGPPRQLRRETGVNVIGRFAAGLAFTAAYYRQFDAPFAERALAVAVALYQYSRANRAGELTNSSAYSGETTADDDAALAALGLLLATGENNYLTDLISDPTLGTNANTFFPRGTFAGGWLANKNPVFYKGMANTSWASTHSYVLFGFYKLVLATDELAARYGITPAQRLQYAEDVMFALLLNIGQNAAGSVHIPVPNAGIWFPNQIQHQDLWFQMRTEQDWIWNRYQAGNIFDILAYAEIARDFEGVALPDDGNVVKPWNSRRALQLGIHQMDYMLGLNPWDISMIYGVGDKFFNHPHHRAANPEGKNVPGAMYRYRPPVGAFQGGMPPGSANDYSEHFDDFYKSEVCLDATTTIIAATTILAADENLNSPPYIDVQIEFVGFDRAIITLRQNRFGVGAINFGTAPNTMTQRVISPNPGVLHRLELTGLDNGTTYYFTASATNQRSGNTTTRYLIDSTQTPFEFTTMTARLPPAEIQNVKVCNIQSDSAEISWFTPNGQYNSKVYWDTRLVPPEQMRNNQDGGVSGLPTRYHRVQIGGLQEKTTYYYAVESNGVIRSTDDLGMPLQFTTPVEHVKFEIRTLQYNWGSHPALGVNIVNMDSKSYDSLEIRFYMRGPANLDNDLGARMDICQAYDEAGFNLPCEDNQGTLIRLARPVRLEDTFDASTNTYAWYFPIPLGATQVKSGSRVRIDIIFDRRSPWPPYTDLMGMAPVKLPGHTPGDWSWDAHSRAAGDPADFPGIPRLDKEDSDNRYWDIPVNPYVTVYRKEEFVWGFSPSHAEQSTRRAHYEIRTEFEAPFDVPNGTYIHLENPSRGFVIRGRAFITQGGTVNDIWVNGMRIADLTGVATYNLAGDYWDLAIPVRLRGEGNQVDITVFAGPSLSCAQCQINGGCAFENRNYFVWLQTQGTNSNMLLQQAGGSPVQLPAIPGSTDFQVVVRDMDKSAMGTLSALVINSRRGDTLILHLTEIERGVFRNTTLVSALAMDAGRTGANQIAFFAGDTIVVRYVDPQDEFDISEQRIYAESSAPRPVAARLVDRNCDGRSDHLVIDFNPGFGASDRMDSLWIILRSSTTADSFMVAFTGDESNQSRLELPLPDRVTIPATASPGGRLLAYIVAEGSLVTESFAVDIRDGIAPLLVGVSLLENSEPRNALDTFKISFSEPVTLSSLQQWPLQLRNGSQIVNSSSLRVIGQATSNDQGRSWLYSVEGNVNGELFREGMVATMVPELSVTDLSFNPLDVNDCGSLVPVIEVPRPVPVEFAEIRDLDTDGQADEIWMRFARKLRPRDMLDSFVVQWGVPSITRVFLPDHWQHLMETRERTVTERVVENIANNDTTWLVIERQQLDTTSTILITLANQRGFPRGLTNGFMNGRGGIIPCLGPAGGFFDIEYALNDKVPPIILAARITENRLAIHTVEITMSEPLDTLQVGGFVHRRRDDAWYLPEFSSQAAGNVWSFRQTVNSSGYLRVGDFVRLTPVPDNKAVDKAGNVPGAGNPWVEVKGPMENSVQVNITMVKNLSGNDSALGQARRRGYDEDPPAQDTHFRLTALSPTEPFFLQLAQGNRRLVSSISGAKYDKDSYLHLGPAFDMELLLPTARQQRGSQWVWQVQVHLELVIWDNLGQFVNTTQYTLDVDQSTRELVDNDGVLHLRLEWMYHQDFSGKMGGVLSGEGRIVGNGAYIGKVNVNVTSRVNVDSPLGGNIVQDENIIPPRGFELNSKASETIIFGFMR